MAQPYHTEYPACECCKIIYAASNLHNGKCDRCRETQLVNIIHCAFLAVAIAGFIAFLLMLAFSYEVSAATSNDLAFARCHQHGDWLETPYCDAAARDMEEV